MSTTRAVLVSYLGSNKVLKIPSGTADDIEYLRGVFCQEFSVEPNIGCIIFQKYDNDWSEYIDLESDAHLQNKDRLKAVVTTSDPTTDSTGGQANLGSTKTVLLKVLL